MTTEEPRPSLYRQLGGGVGIAAITDEFCRRVLADETLGPHCSATDTERLGRHQAAFLAAALGEPDSDEVAPPREAHAGCGIGAGHFAAEAGHLAAALRACDVPEALTETIIARVAAL